MSRIVGRGGYDPYGPSAADLELQPSALARSNSSTSSRSLGHTRSVDHAQQALVAPYNEYNADQQQHHSYASGSTIVPYAYPPPPPPSYGYSQASVVGGGAAAASTASVGPPLGHAAYYDAVPDEPKKPFYKRIPWLAVTVVVACLIVFVVTMAVNNCPGHPHPRGQSCVLPFLGRFSFEPLSVNPLFGPTAMTLQSMGALNSNLITNYHQGWRLLTAMWLHGGVVHLLCNLLAIAFLLNRLEKEFGLWRPAVIYLLSGVFSSVFSALFLDTQISVGASGALFGLVGACLSELLINWGLYENRVSALITLIVLILVNLAIGLLPYIDNFAHIGGCLAGFLLGFALLLRPQRGYIDLRDTEGVQQATAIAAAGGDPVTTKYSACQWWTRMAAAVAFLGMFTACITVLFTSGSTGGSCEWCKYLSCVPSPWWSCDATPQGTQGGGPICQVRTYPNGTGALVCTNQTMATVPNISSVATADLRVLCTQTCSA
eukprot:TRINITY_DN5942_c0_g1_i3.p1 TRINITY_DN5942_c0_g1~~TRINITY_DN5942_c0_g1_i3.p1  ORF type:complete len:489 (-),score=-26.19 TRINITY_DN5942_c0_g1_i3:246-1712(-)